VNTTGMKHYIRTHPDNLPTLQASYGDLTQTGDLTYEGYSAVSGWKTPLHITLDPDYDEGTAGKFTNHFVYEGVDLATKKYLALGDGFNNLTRAVRRAVEALNAVPQKRARRK
jgi:hypothetical protein